MSHGYFYQFPGTGHGVFLTNACPYHITATFLDTPTSAPDASCITDMSAPTFLTK